MNIKKTIVASLLACMLPAVVMAKDVSIASRWRCLTITS